MKKKLLLLCLLGVMLVSIGVIFAQAQDRHQVRVSGGGAGGGQTLWYPADSCHEAQEKAKKDTRAVRAVCVDHIFHTPQQ